MILNKIRTNRVGLAAKEHSNSLRGILLYGISVASITGTLKIDLPGAGALCCLVCALCCSYGWQNGLPWRFKHINPEAIGLNRDSHNAESSDSSKDSEEVDTEANKRKKTQDSEGGKEKSEIESETMHHEYYRQHLRALRKLLKKGGGVAGSKNALAMVSRSSRRFSLPEPKPNYEEDEFDEILGSVDYDPWVFKVSKILKSNESSSLPDKKRRTKLTRSLSASRPSHSRSTRNRTTSDSIRPDLNMDVVTEENSNADKDGETVSTAAANAPSVAEDSKKRGRKPSEDTTDKELTETEKAELLELAKAKGNECLKVMRAFISTCWWFLQPLLFCLIGADIPFEKLKGPVILRGIASLAIALCFRLLASFLSVLPSKMNMKERLFVAIAWIPKATVQAAIGPLALDSARKFGDPDQIRWGEEDTSPLPIYDEQGKLSKVALVNFLLHSESRLIRINQEPRGKILDLEPCKIRSKRRERRSNLGFSTIFRLYPPKSGVSECNILNKKAPRCDFSLKTIAGIPFISKKLGVLIIALAALSIIITAPAAAFLIPIVAPHLLKQSESGRPSQTINPDTQNHKSLVSRMRIHNTVGSHKKNPKIARTYENEAVSATQETAL
ncbi:hypothetical protein ACTXT7_011359 [Hymenolepis weldensis]